MAELINRWVDGILKHKEISKKLKTFAHIEYRGEKYSNIEVIKKKKMQD